MKRFARFLLVGAIGFAVDMLLLVVLIDLGLSPLGARGIAIAGALFVTWWINRMFTFGPSGRSVAAEGGRYGTVGFVTSLINYAVYSGILLMLPRLSPVLAATAGSAVATLFSYLGYSKLVFRR